MRLALRFAGRQLLFAGITAVLAGLLHGTSSAQAPPDGYNAICLTSACTDTGINTTIAASAAFIDASAFISTTYDFCQTINVALFELASTSVGGANGGIIDARGINPGTSGTNKCANNLFTSPNNITTPATILLPSGIISISAPWILPDRTRIIGEGNNPQNGTEIFAASNFGAMIEMGSSTLCLSNQCYGISVEYVFLDGESNPINGIINQYGGTGSYVDHVNLHFIDGTALIIGQNATDSGPYSNIAITSGSTQCVAATSCVHLGDSTYGSPLSTRGIHGLTCTCDGGTGQAGVTVNSSNNTLEDIHFEGYIDGIELGPQGNAQNNVILNVNGGGNDEGGTINDMTNVIHICSSTSTGCANSNTVSNVTIQTAVSTNANGGTVKNVIQDDLTGTTIPSLGTPNVTAVGMYVLGDSAGAGGYSRFTTGSTSSSATNISSWFSGTSTPTGSCQPGSLFSNVNGVAGGTSGNYTLWVCSAGTWVHLAQ